MSYLYLQVQLLQSSNKRNPNLKINAEQTVVENNSISFHHTETDYAKIIRAYIHTVTSHNHIFLFEALLSKIKIEEVPLILCLAFQLLIHVITSMFLVEIG